MSFNEKTFWAKFKRFAHIVIEYWALLGGAFVIGVVLINAYSITASALINKPFSGDFELTEMGIGIAIFCFLPFCQLNGANVSADIFTVHAKKKTIAFMSLLAAFIALAFSCILIWRMSAGLADYILYEEITGILSIPIWWAFIPALMSVGLLVVASLINLIDAFGETNNAGARL